LNFELKHLQRIACDVMKLRTKFKRNRTIRGGVIAITVFDLMTLNMFQVLRLALGSFSPNLIFDNLSLPEL